MPRSQSSSVCSRSPARSLRPGIRPAAAPWTSLAYTLLAIGPAALLWRRRHPAAVLVVVFATTLAYWVSDYPRGPVFFALIVAFLTAVMAGLRIFAIVVVVAGWLAFTWLPYLVGNESEPSPAATVGLLAWLLVLSAIGEIARVSRERAAERTRSREEEALRRASEERLRIARELHDVLAHNISLINVQAGVALHLMDEQPGAGAHRADRDQAREQGRAERAAVRPRRAPAAARRHPGHPSAARRSRRRGLAGSSSGPRGASRRRG